MFAVGDNVRVAGIEVIRKSLAASGDLNGCVFMKPMEQFCGLNFEITKIVKNAFFNNKLVKFQPPFYVLNDLRCGGNVDKFEHQCDRYCFLLWHEKWLEQI